MRKYKVREITVVIPLERNQLARSAALVHYNFQQEEEDNFAPKKKEKYWHKQQVKTGS